MVFYNHSDIQKQINLFVQSYCRVITLQWNCSVAMSSCIWIWARAVFRFKVLQGGSMTVPGTRYPSLGMVKMDASASMDP